MKVIILYVDFRFVLRHKGQDFYFHPQTSDAIELERKYGLSVKNFPHGRNEDI